MYLVNSTMLVVWGIGDSLCGRGGGGGVASAASTHDFNEAAIMEVSAPSGIPMGPVGWCGDKVGSEGGAGRGWGGERG